MRYFYLLRGRNFYPTVNTFLRPRILIVYNTSTSLQFIYFSIFDIHKEKANWMPETLCGKDNTQMNRHCGCLKKSIMETDFQTHLHLDLV